MAAQHFHRPKSSTCPQASIYRSAHSCRLINFPFSLPFIGYDDELSGGLEPKQLRRPLLKTSV